MTLAGDRYAYANFVKTPTSTTTNYYHTDMIGSVRAITDEAGATVIRHDYLPFGEDTQPLTGDPMRFGGKELDSESALMNFEARYYRNTWGRFTQVDPIGGSLGDTQSWNRYAYARNNPLRYVDPTGMNEACPYDACVSATAEAVGIFAVGTVRIGSGSYLDGQSSNDSTVVRTDNGDCLGFTNGVQYTTWRCEELSSGIGGPGTSESPTATPSVTVTTTIDTSKTANGCKDLICEMVADAGNRSAPIVPVVQTGLDLAMFFLGPWAQTGQCFFAGCGPTGQVMQAVLPIRGFTKHGINRVIGDFERAGVSPASLLETLRNPSSVSSGVDELGRPFSILEGSSSRAIVNPATGKVISVNPYGRP